MCGCRGTVRNLITDYVLGFLAMMKNEINTFSFSIAHFETDSDIDVKVGGKC